MRIVCQQTILIKYHALFVIFEKAAKFEILLQTVGGVLRVKTKNQIGHLEKKILEEFCHIWTWHTFWPYYFNLNAIPYETLVNP